MDTPRNVNDGSSRPPRLAVYGNGWGLSELPRRPSDITWTFEQTLEKLVAEGFDGMQADMDRAALVRKYRLRFATHARINLPAEADPTLRQAADAQADCITIHAGWGMETDAETDALVGAILDASAKYGVPAYLETHRATLTQDIFRTCCLLVRIPQVRFNGDFSHYYCGHELTYRGFPITRHYLEPLLDRVGFLHARVSNGESMQVDTTHPWNAPHLENFRWIWQKSMSAWLKRALPGDILPFSPELGPASSGYSITMPDGRARQVELSDRWQQTLVLRDFGRSCFAAASGTETN